MDEKRQSGYLIGIVGAMIGGLIASLPWILVYVYGDMIFSLLALPIALGAWKGYQLMKGKQDGKLPYIVAVISLLVITLATLVIIPMLLGTKNGLNFSFDTLDLLYQSSEFKTAIFKDYAISVLFTFLGIGGVLGQIKESVEE